MSWKIIPCHRIAHLEPVADSGTVATTHNKGAASTLDLRDRYKGTGTPIRWRWDRGATATEGNINCVVIVSHFATTSLTHRVYKHSTSTFGSATALYTATAFPANSGGVFKSFTADVEQWWWVEIGASPTALEVGCISLGEYFDIGDPELGWSHGEGTNNAGNIARTVTATFNNVAEADALEIMEFNTMHSVFQGGVASSTVQIGVGGRSRNGTKNPVALVDNDGIVYWGEATITASYARPGKAILNVSLTESAGVLAASAST